MSEPDDTQLLIATARGDDAAARALWARHGGALLAYARAVLGPSMNHEAEDVVQAVMCSIMSVSTWRLRAVRNVRVWLGTATRRTAINTLRTAGRSARRAGRVAVHTRATRDGPDRSSPSLIGSSSPTEPELALAIESLPRAMREVVTLRHSAELTFDQIATALNEPRGTVASRYAAALKRLRAAMGHDTSEPVSGPSRRTAPDAVARSSADVPSIADNDAFISSGSAVRFGGLA